MAHARNGSSRGLLVLWLAESQRLSDGARTTVESDLDDVGDVISTQCSLLGAISLNEKRQRLCDSNGVRELYKCSLAQAALHDGFGHLSADVSSRSINFSGILARKCASSMGSPTSICVDDNLAGWVDVKVCVVPIQSQGGLSVFQCDFCQGLLHDLLHDELIHLLHAWGCRVWAFVPGHLLAASGLQWLRMLCGDNNSMNLLRLNRAILPLQILDGDLSLAIWSQPPKQPTLAHVCQLLAQARGHGMCQWHTVLRLIASIAEHDSLVASTYVEVILAHVHSPCNVRALLVYAHHDLTSLVAQALAVNAGEIIHVRIKAYLRHDSTDDLLVIDLSLCGDLPSDNHHVVLGRCLASDFAFGIVCQAGIQDSIGNLIAELIRVALVHRLRGEQEHALIPGLFLRRFCHWLHSFLSSRSQETNQ